MSDKKRSLNQPWRIFSILIIACMIVSFIAPFTTQTAYALDVPQPLYPADFANTTPVTDPPLGIPSFTWTAVAGATKYYLQVDNDIGFNSPIIMDVRTPHTTYTPERTNWLFADGDWYWRVRVEEPGVPGDWSNIMTFTKTWATYDNKPTPIAPDEGATLAFFDSPVFSWTPVLGAAKYRFQIAITPDGFDTPILTAETLTPAHQPKDRLANQTYYWRVVPMDTADHFGTPSDVRSFTMAYGTYAMGMVPTLLEPLDETYPTFTPTFHWTAILGAEHYRLEYTSDETCDFSVGTGIDTRQTSYTPTDTFPNDARYCWRVRVESGPGVGDWSETWHFQKKWYLQPLLLTPTDLYPTGLYPMYSWSPVPGASRYNLEISLVPGFNPLYEDITTANTTCAPQNRYLGTAHYWWRVTPIDGGGELGLTSDVFEFQSYYTSTAPIQVYPLYYYLPNDYGPYTMNPYEDRTVAFPIFMWHRITNPFPDGGTYATAYRIQVDTTPYFSNIVWEYDTENTSATPTAEDNFIPVDGQDYFWRVCPLDGIGGNCLTNSVTGAEWWSQIWKTRYNDGLQLPPTAGYIPELLRPAVGQESVEATPLLEWWPLQSATQYQVEINSDMNFTSTETIISETVNIPAYSPVTSLAQRSLDRTDYGTFYWRVRAYVGGIWRDWSDGWRFQVASQSDWRFIRTLANPDNQLLIGDDPAGDAGPTYDLTTLYVSQSETHWFLGFNANLTSPDMTYVFYIDLDNEDGSGATTSPTNTVHTEPFDVTTIPAHQPEFAIYVDKFGGVINAQNTWVFAWLGTHWGYGQRMSDIDGLVYANAGYVELQLLNGAIGMTQNTSSASIALFSVDTSTLDVRDSVPSDPEAPGSAQLSRFSAVSEHMNLIYPPSTATGDPTTIPSVLPFYWDWSVGISPSTPFAGSFLEVHLDPSYTNLKASFHIYSDTPYFSENNVSLVSDIVGDNIYYWRVLPRYLSPGREAFGAWVGGWSFRRLGLVAQNLQTSVTFSTPTFTWDMTEGADTYRLQVSLDPNFGTTVINQTTPMTSYTPPGTLAQGDYYWRVQVNRYPSIGNDWSTVEQFSLSLPTPSGLTPDGMNIHYAPTFCWDPLIRNDDHGVPVLTAWRYHVQVSQDPNYSSTYDSVDTSNNCWTPTKGYADGTYYWHVYMIDGNGKVGFYSPTATFIKQYPITTLISPINGSVPQTPTFIWTPVDGAATYRFEVSQNPSFSPLYDSIDTINTQYTPPKIYTPDRVYYWRVAIKDRNGNLGPFTDAQIIIGDVYFSFLPAVRK